MARKRRDARQDSDQELEEKPRVARTARTLAATAVNKIGLRLAEFPPDALDQLALPEDLRDAIDACQRMKIRGRSRQKRLICQILRSEDHQAITERIKSFELSERRSKK